MTEKMEKILDRIYQKVKDISEEEVRVQREAWAKLSELVHFGQYRIWHKAHEIFCDIYFRQAGRPLTEKQIKLINKFHPQLKKLEKEMRKWRR